MTEILRSLDEVDPGYRVLFCDLWGCLHDGVRAFLRRWLHWSAFAPLAAPWCC